MTRSASSTTPDDDMSVVPVSGVAANETKRQRAETDEVKAEIPTTCDEDGRRGSGHVGAAAGEWNLLPVLVERLREALELSLGAGCRRGDEPTMTSLAEIGAEVDDRLHTHRFVEQAVLSDHENLESKKDELKFLENLLLLDIQTALSRLRETLEHTNVTVLAKHGGVSDPTSKLHLLRLVSSLLSRLQVPQRETTTTEEHKLTDIATVQSDASATRKQRPVRHTIGVSAEEIAYARKQLEESSADLTRLSKVQRQREPLLVPSSAPNITSNDTLNHERHTEEICDKYTKDAINQRQSLRDKNKDCRGNVSAHRPVTIETGEPNMLQDQPWNNNIDDKEAVIQKANEEESRVTKLAAVLRQRAELVSASRCNVNNNKFTAKKSKIKRANTVDIPSYLKMQANSFGCDKSGCVQLRRPINVGDKITLSATNNVAVPSFHPRTENDKKFLALINRNNEVQTTFNVPPAFKSFGYTKVTNMSSLTNENWNSRFSNIKTAFDKPSSVNDENKLSSKAQPARCFPGTPQTPPQLINKRTSIGTDNFSSSLPFANTNALKSDMGFRHAPSSLFRKIEKPQSPPSYHWFKDNVPPSGNTLRDKARIMFGRDNNVQSQSTTKFKIEDHECSQKSSFPRPPWIERGKNDGKSSEMITENGRLDYRLFCKQFAPFIGKNITSEPKKLRNIEEQHNRNKSSMQREIFLPCDQKLAIMDEKIPFEKSPEKESRIQKHYKASESRCGVENEVCDKFDFHSEKNISDPIHNRQYNEQNISGNAVTDVIFSGSSSIGIQTSGNNDSQSENVRVFRVIPRVSRDTSFICNDASVQTYNQPMQPLTDYVESKKEWTAPRYECNDTSPILNSNFHSTKDPKSFVLDNNWNYPVEPHTAVTDVALKNESPISENTYDFIEKQPSIHMSNPVENMSYQSISDYHSPEQHEQVFQINNPPYKNRFSAKLTTEDQLQMYQNYPSDVKFNKEFENEMPSVSREIDTKDSSCMNNDSLPEEQNIQNQDISVDAGVVTRYTCAIATVASADTSEMQLQRTGLEFQGSVPSPSHFQSHAKETNNKITTAEEEIRRHNMLQQSLVRRLQNERKMLNDQYTSIPKQLSSFNQPSKLQSSDVPLVTGFLSVPPNSGSCATNRVTALREQYEQPDGQSKSVQRERSPIPTNVSGAIDSSDKYLLSRSNKSARSIVLSKSESWHQLALSNSHHPPPRPSQGGLPPTSSHLLKLPKPKSPSFFRTKKQYEASLSSDSVKKMEDKIRRYFDHSNDATDAKNSKSKHFSSHNVTTKGLVGLSRSRTMPGIYDEKLHLLIPAVPQISTTNLNSADVDKVFDDIFEEATRTEDHRF